MQYYFSTKDSLSPPVKKVVIFHGLFCNSAITIPLKAMLSARQYQCLTLSYPTRKQNTQANAKFLLPKIQAFADGEPVYFVGHSLGGLLIRHLQKFWPEGFDQTKVVTLGTPHMGSKVANYFHEHHLRNKILGESWYCALDGLAPGWHSAAPLLSIAGTKAFGVGMTLNIFGADEPNDGTVAVAETRLPEASAYQEVPATHTALLFSPTTVELIDNWFRK